MSAEIGQILGVPRPSAGNFDFVVIVERGLPARSINKLKTALGLSDQDVSETLGVSAKTISRLRAEPKKRLNITVGDRLYRAARIFAQAVSVFEDENAARQWLRTSQIGLGNRIPLDLIRTDAGCHQIEELLGRIEHGVLS